MDIDEDVVSSPPRSSEEGSSEEKGFLTAEGLLKNEILRLRKELMAAHKRNDDLGSARLDALERLREERNKTLALENEIRHLQHNTKVSQFQISPSKRVEKRFRIEDNCDE